MKLFKSLIKRYVVLSILFGIGMGVAFPFIAQLFTEYKRPEFQLVFFIVCIAAGVMVGGFSIIIGSATLLKASGSIGTKLAKIVEERDLTQRVILDSDDSLGELAANINLVLDDLDKLFAALKHDGEELLQCSDHLQKCSENGVLAADEMSTAIGKLSENSGIQMENVNSLQNSVNDLFSSIRAISNEVGIQGTCIDESTAAVEEMSASINSVADMARKASQLSSELSASANLGEEEVGETIRLIHTIEEASRGIYQLIGVISHIASRTNLLAVNAAIEAAHAGDSGQGFAIVAEEVRNLSEESSDGVKGISGMISDIADKIGLGVASSEATDKALSGMTEGIRESTEVTGFISSSILEQNTASEQLIKLMQSLVAATAHIRETVTNQQVLGEEARQSTVNLIESADETMRVTGTHEQVEAQLRGVTREIREAAVRNRQISDKFEKLLGGYKV